VSQPPGGYYRERPQGQAPWPNYPPPGYPPQGPPPQGPPPGYPPQGLPPGYWQTGQRDAPSPGYKVPQKSPHPRRARRKPLRKRDAILIAIAVFFVIAVIASALGGSGKSAKSPVAASSSAASSALKLIAKEANACDNRPPASGDIYVRMVTPGTSPQAQELGGEWRWDSATNKCLTSVQLMIATAPRSAGNCTQVGYVADNPSYDPNDPVAAPFAHVVAQAGPACQAAAPSTPFQTTPAATLVAPASTAPAGCYPLSDEGTCYEPGEYCRDADHGMSGVAGDGEAIVCEDNDGWRWEPA
jgi:hypothetical protein